MSLGILLGVRRVMGRGSGSSDAVSEIAEDVAMPLLLLLPLRLGLDMGGPWEPLDAFVGDPSRPVGNQHAMSAGKTATPSLERS